MGLRQTLQPFSERAAALLPFLHHYNHHRPSFGINARPPNLKDPSQALNIVRKDKSKGSGRVKFKRAAWQNDFLASLLGQI
jgi:hypothetical protein